MHKFIFIFLLMFSKTLICSQLSSVHSIDIIFCVNNGPKMQTRLPGYRYWINPNRIQGAYNASVNFVDSFFETESRVALFNYTGIVDTAFPYESNLTHIRGLLDSNLLGNSLNLGNALWRTINQAILYAEDHARPDAQLGLIALTADNDNGSYNPTPGPGILGRTQADAVDSLLRTLSAARLAGLRINIFIVGVGNGVRDLDGLLTKVTDTANGKYLWTYDGAGLDSIFQSIGNDLLYDQAIEIACPSRKTSSLMIYPSPASTLINLPLSSLSNNTSISLINIYGSYHTRIYRIKENIMSYDISTVPNGVYIIKIADGQNGFYNKITILH